MTYRKMIAFGCALVLTLCGMAVAQQQGMSWHFDMMRKAGSSGANNADFLYCVGTYDSATTNAVLLKYRSSDLSLVTTGSTSERYPVRMASDGDSVFLGDYYTDRILKYDCATVTRQAYTGFYGGAVYALTCVTGTVIATGAGNQNLKRYKSSDLSLISTSATLSYDGFSLLADIPSNTLYVGTAQSLIRRHNLGTLGYVSSSDSKAAAIVSLATLTPYVFSGSSAAAGTLYRDNLLLNTPSGSTNLGAAVYALASGNGHIYAGTTAGRLVKISPSTLGVVASVTGLGGIVRGILVADTYVYATVTSNKGLFKYTADLTLITNVVSGYTIMFGPVGGNK